VAGRKGATQSLGAAEEGRCHSSFVVSTSQDLPRFFLVVNYLVDGPPAEVYGRVNQSVDVWGLR
jgi:hypothetical protein